MRDQTQSRVGRGEVEGDCIIRGLLLWGSLVWIRVRRTRKGGHEGERQTDERGWGRKEDPLLLGGGSAVPGLRWTN